jgi:ribonuclease HIII
MKRKSGKSRQRDTNRVPKFSKISQLEVAITAAEKKCTENGLILKLKKEIPYGTQIKGEDSLGGVGKVTCYFSKKKGLSVVDNSSNGISEKISQAIKGKEISNVPEAPKTFRAIIGTDEAGKGDFFGPLVTVSFFIESEKMEQELLELGVQDSKKINDKKIKTIAKNMREKWPDHFVVVAPSVPKYNDLYKNIGNLNRLLGWMHGRAIEDLYNRFKERGVSIKTAVVDKFGDKKNVTNSIGGLDDIKIEAVVRGEEAEVAIAAASVIARDTFLTKMFFLSKDFDMNFPLGAGGKVDAAGREYKLKNGVAALSKVAKTHFKTMHKL